MPKYTFPAVEQGDALSVVSVLLTLNKHPCCFHSTTFLLVSLHFCTFFGDFFMMATKHNVDVLSSVLSWVGRRL